MTEKLDPHEVFADDPREGRFVVTPPTPELLLRSRVASILGELESLAPLLPTLPEMADADEALRALRHLRKQLEGTG